MKFFRFVRLFWNINLTCENLNSIYNGDKRKDFVNE